MFDKRFVSVVAIVVVFAMVVTPLMGSGARWGWFALVGGVGVALVFFFARRGRHTPWATASNLVTPGHAVVFWKPGCSYCERLLLAIGKNERVTWVNVRVDKDANEVVRRLNGGDELTPTALVGGRVLRNPSANELVESLSA